MKFIIVLLAISASAIGYTYEDIKCIPLSTFKLDCNTCSCSRDGKIGFCTYMACLTNPGTITYLTIPENTGSDNFSHIPENTGSETKQICQPLSTYKDYCNICKCNVDGTRSSCTKMACNKEVWNPDGSLKSLPHSNRVSRSVAKQVCQPRTLFKSYCNSCTCSDDGTNYACTRMACDKDVWNPDGSVKTTRPNSNRVTRSATKQVCEPRTTFKDYCNTCSCSVDGTSFACTRKACDKNIWNSDGTVKISATSNRVTRSASKQMCKPLSQFKDYCNTCGCASDGMSYACTRMACDKNIWNKDGSLTSEAQNLLAVHQKNAVNLAVTKTEPVNLP